MTELVAGMMATPNIVLEKKLAEGGMGSVWVADHLTLKTRVAVKFVRAEYGKDKDAMARFEREATAVARIKSPHIVQVLDYGRSDAAGQPFIVMELLDGEDLGTRIARQGPLSLGYVANLMSQAAKAMGKAHQAGIVHRDIKPDNLFLVDPDGDVFVKMLDFGIAKWTEPSLSSMTSTGSMMGTPHYMAPEQMTSAKDVAPASDLWALGVVAYNALTAKVPFDGETLAALAISVHTGKYDKVTELVPGLPAALDDWFKKALAKEPGDRFATARELGETFRAIAEGREWSNATELAVSAQTMNAASKSVPKGEAPTVAVKSETINRASTVAPVRDASRSKMPIALVVAGVAVLGIGGYALKSSFSAKGDAPTSSTQIVRATVSAPAEHAPPPRPASTAPVVEPAGAVVVASASSASLSASASPSPSASAAPAESAVVRNGGRPLGGAEGQGSKPTTTATAKATAAPTTAPTASPTGVPVTF